MSKKVILGLSGGVDSSVALFLLKEQGYNVEAVFMKNWEETSEHNQSNCTATIDFQDAQSVCNTLNIQLHTVNFSQEYWQRVFQYMLDEYAQGRTPNPDIMCNKEIKFKEFLNYAKTLNADFIATGHYAKKIYDINSNSYKLYKANDLNKDQTYFLYTLTQERLAYTLFPLSEIDKTQVRTLATKLQLSNHQKKDSTGICFIGERNFKKFLSEYLLAKPGDIIDDKNQVIGRHNGLMFYTLGQRQGLGIGGRKGSNESPWYVVRKNISTNQLVVAQDSFHPYLMSNTLHCDNIHWISGQQPTLPLQCCAKIRYRQQEQACTIISNTNTIESNNQYTYCIKFTELQRAITSGQSVVIYTQNGECLGGGIIK